MNFLASFQSELFGVERVGIIHMVSLRVVHTHMRAKLFKSPVKRHFFLVEKCFEKHNGNSRVVVRTVFGIRQIIFFAERF